MADGRKEEADRSSQREVEKEGECEQRCRDQASSYFTALHCNLHCVVFKQRAWVSPAYDWARDLTLVSMCNRVRERMCV